MAKSTLPYSKRVTDAVDKIGTFNGTKLADPTVPAEIATNNEQRDEYMAKHSAVAELLVSGLVKKHAEARYEKAKAKLYTCIPKIKQLSPGTNESYVMDNVALNARAQNGQTRVDRQKLLSKLMTDQKMSLDAASTFVTACENVGSPVIYLTPSVVSE